MYVDQAIDKVLRRAAHGPGAPAAVTSDFFARFPFN